MKTLKETFSTALFLLIVVSTQAQTVIRGSRIEISNGEVAGSPNDAGWLATAAQGNKLIARTISSGIQGAESQVFQFVHEFKPTKAENNNQDVNLNEVRNNGYIGFNRGSGYNNGFLTMGSSGVERLRITSNGNIGIGTTNPANKLDVKGTIRAKEVLITQTGWSDFVFEKEYALRPLKEVEAFINQHGHLPEVPTAKEVAEHGIEVGKTEALLLQKIEELTLYIIDLEKRVGGLEKK